MPDRALPFVLPAHTRAALDFESGLRIHWNTLDLLLRGGHIAEQILLSVGIKQRHPDPDFLYETVFGKTEAEVAEMNEEELRRIMRETARMKSGYVNPAAGPDGLRRSVVNCYLRHGVTHMGIDQVLYGPGGASQGLDTAIGGLFQREGIAFVDLPCWPGTPPKIRAHGPTPVGMFRVHDSFEANRKHMAPMIDRGIAGVYTSFPGNPIGLQLNRTRLDVLTRTRLWLRDTCLKAGKPAPIWVADEVYLEQPEDTLTLLAAEDTRDVVAVFSATKGRLQAGHRDHFVVVGNDPTLKKWLASKAKDGLSGNVGWRYAAALEHLLNNGHEFLARERELDRIAGEAFQQSLSGVDGMMLDSAIANQYRYIHLQGIPEGMTSDDLKRFALLEAAATGSVFVDWVPGVYFNLPALLEPAGIDINEVDGIRTILAYEPKVMARAGRQIARQWEFWRKAGFPQMPTWKDLEQKLDQGMKPRQILEQAGYQIPS